MLLSFSATVLVWKRRWCAARLPWVRAYLGHCFICTTSASQSFTGEMRNPSTHRMYLSLYGGYQSHHGRERRGTARCNSRITKTFVSSFLEPSNLRVRFPPEFPPALEESATWRPSETAEVGYELHTISFPFEPRIFNRRTKGGVSESEASHQC